MRTVNGAKQVGVFTVDVELTNHDDLVAVRLGVLKPNQVRRQTVRGVVDSGAAMLVLPQTVVKELGLPLGDKVKVRYADGRRAERREANSVRLKLAGRAKTFDAVVEPKRTTALVGAIVLEALDLLVDCTKQRVVPRDPRGPVYEIE